MFKLEQIPGTNTYQIRGGDGKRFECAPDGAPLPVCDSDGIDTELVVFHIGKHSGHASAFGFMISEPQEIMGGHKIRAIQYLKLLK